MTFNFRKIYATDPVFREIRARNKTDYLYFKNYANKLTIMSGKAKSNASGKSHSYASYLIRLVYIYEDLYKEELSNLLNFDTLKKIEKVVNSSGFQKYNQTEWHFPNSAFNCYVSCLIYLNSDLENTADIILNESLAKMNYVESNKNINLINGAKMRDTKINNGINYAYPRKKEESMEAKKNSNWTCELDSNHETFLCQSNETPYVEAHHLIPMAAQDYFENTLDFADNIVALCPNCHRMIHYATNKIKYDALKTLFNNREVKYPTYGIDINFNRLLNFYEIF